MAEQGGDGGANNPGTRILGGPLLITMIFFLFLVRKCRINDHSKSMYKKISVKLLHRRLVKLISIVNRVLQFVYIAICVISL